MVGIGAVWVYIVVGVKTVVAGCISSCYSMDKDEPKRYAIYKLHIGSLASMVATFT